MPIVANAINEQLNTGAMSQFTISASQMGQIGARRQSLHAYDLRIAAEEARKKLTGQPTSRDLEIMAFDPSYRPDNKPRETQGREREYIDEFPPTHTPEPESYDPTKNAGYLEYLRLKEASAKKK